MSKMDITDLDCELRQGKLRPIYIIVGAEQHLALSALREIGEAVKAAGTDPLSAASFTGREARPEGVLGALRTVPMLGGRPLVVIREGEALSPEMQEAIAQYMEHPVGASTLVVVAAKLDGRARFMQAAARLATVVECKPLYADRIPAWINIEAKRKGRQISQEAARFLADMVGTDLGQLSQAIERVILFVGDRKIVELRDVEEAIAETNQHSIFEFTDAVGMRRWPRALSLLKGILDSGEPPVLILRMLARHFRILSKAKEVTGRMADGGEVAKYLGVHPYYAKNYIAQAKNFSAGELRSSFQLLYRCDRELKSSRLPKERILERALFGIMEKRGAEVKPRRGRSS